MNTARLAPALALAALLTSDNAALRPGRAAAPAPAVPPGYTLAWSEEFAQPAGSAPDPAVWQYNLGNNHGWGNGELEDYVNDREHAQVVADPAATDGKALQIAATTDGQGHYQSARLMTSDRVAFRYGYMVARIKLPAGQGLWPAFWMLGQNIGQAGWPGCGEMDIMENLGREPSINHGSFHGPGYSGGHSLTASYTLPGGQHFSDAYHTFALEWSPNAASYLVDGIKYETRTPADVPPGGSWVFNKPFFFVVNLAVGGGWPGAPDATTHFPQTLRVDYIRVYQRSAPPVGRTIRLKAAANGQYVAVTPAGNLRADQTAPSDTGKFLIVGRGAGQVALRSIATKKYVGASSGGALTAASATVGPAQTFQWADTGDGGVTLYSFSAHKYVSADHAGQDPLTANRPGPDTWETFTATTD